MVATAALGATFVGMQAFEWTKLISEGVRPWENPFGAAQFGSSFFMITGFHGMHVTAGVIYLMWVAIRVKKGVYERRGNNYEIVEIAGLYWHFVDLVWVFIFAFFYLVYNNMLSIGDKLGYDLRLIVYLDEEPGKELREEYRRQRDVHGLQPLLHNTSHLAVWDDHDFALNNHDRTNPIKEQALVVFKDYWANPSYGLPDVPGVFFSYSYGDVDFFFVDDRYYRDPNTHPDAPQKTMLGTAQFEWLQSGLKGSTAIFKVIVSGSGFTKAKGEGGDSWAAFLSWWCRIIYGPA